MSSLYEKIWRRIGGRPWTHIIRDSVRDHPLPWIAWWLFLGSCLGHLFW